MRVLAIGLLIILITVAGCINEPSEKTEYELLSEKYPGWGVLTQEEFQQRYNLTQKEALGKVRGLNGK